MPGDRVPLPDVPTYQYACTECGHAFEQFQSFSDDALTSCPRCEGRLRKVYNAVGVVFKGSGFYRTDSRSDASPGSGSGGSSNGSQGSSGSSEAGSSGSSGSSASGSGSSSNGSSSPGSGSSSSTAGAAAAS